MGEVATLLCWCDFSLTIYLCVCVCCRDLDGKENTLYELQVLDCPAAHIHLLQEVS